MSDDQNIPMWKPKDIDTWLQSGDIQKDLIVGPHTIEFKDIEEYDAPNEEELLIEEDKTLTVLKKYTRYIPKGKLIIKLSPVEFDDIVNTAWRIKGTDYWRPSLYVEEKVLIGDYEIEFKDSQFCKAREPLVVTILDKKITEVEYTFFTTGTPDDLKEDLTLLSNTNIEIRKRVAPEVINVTIEGAEGVIDSSVIVGKYGEPLEIFLQGSYVFNYTTLMDKITSTVPIKFKFPHKIVTDALYENGTISFDIDWFNDIKEDLIVKSNILSKGRQVGGIFTREEPYIASANLIKVDKRVALKEITIKEDIYFTSNSIINNTKRQFIQKDELEDQPTISSDIILNVSKDTKERRSDVKKDELVIIAPIADVLIKRKTLKDLITKEEFIYSVGLITESFKKAIMKLNTFQEDTIYNTIPEVISSEKHDPSVNLFKIVDIDKLSVNANNSLEVSKLNHKIKRDIKLVEEPYIASNNVVTSSKQGKFTFINMNEEPYIASNDILSASKQTKMLVNTTAQDDLYNNSLITISSEKKSNLNKIIATKEEPYITSGAIVSASLRNDFLTKHTENISSVNISSDIIANITKENLAIKKSKFIEESLITATTSISNVEKHDPRFTIAGVKDNDAPYFKAGELLYIEKRSFVKDIYFIDLDPTYSADYINSCEKRKNIERVVITTEEIIAQADFIYQVDKSSKLPMFPYLVDNDAMICLTSDNVLYGAKKSHLLKEPEDFNDLVFNSIITLEAFTKSHLLKVNATNEDPTITSNIITNGVIKSHLLKVDSSTLDPTVKSDTIISASIDNIYNTNTHLEESYVASNNVTLVEIKDKFIFNTQLEEPYISSDNVLIAEKQVP